MGQYMNLNNRIREIRVDIHNMKIEGVDPVDIYEKEVEIGELEGALFECAEMDGLEDQYEAFDYHDENMEEIECPTCGRWHLLKVTNDEYTKIQEYKAKRWTSEGFVFQSIFPNRNVYEIQLLKYQFTGDHYIHCCDKCEQEDDIW